MLDWRVETKQTESSVRAYSINPEDESLDHNSGCEKWKKKMH